MIAGQWRRRPPHRCARANPQSFAEDDRSHAPSAGHPTRRRERIAGIHGLSIDTIELYERNMIDELVLRLVHRELPVGS
jgi:hypothetical protein